MSKATARARVNPVNAAAARVIQSDRAADAEMRRKLEEDLADDAQGLWSKLGMQDLFTYRPSSAAKTIMILTAKVLGYAIGAVGTIIAVSTLSMVLQAFGWPLFIVAVIEIFAYVMGVLASWYLSDKVVNFIVDGGVSRTIGGAASWVKGAFDTTKSAVSRRFETVH